MAVWRALRRNIGSYLRCHFDEVRNHSSSSGVGGTLIMGLSDSSTSTPVSPFSGSTKWILNEIDRSLLANAARASSRSRRRDTLRINPALVPARGRIQGVGDDTFAESRRLTDIWFPAPGTPFPSPNLRTRARSLPNADAVARGAGRPHAVKRDQPGAGISLPAGATA